MTQENEYTALYPEAAAEVRVRLADEPIYWMGGQSLRYSLRWVLAILLLGMVCLVLGRYWQLHVAELLAGLESYHWLVQRVVEWLLAHVYMIYLLPLASVLFAGCILIATMRTLYVVTQDSLVIMTKSGKGPFTAFALNNVDKVEMEDLHKSGAGNLRLRFISPLKQGRLRRDGCTLNGVRDVRMLRDFLQEHVDRIPPADLPKTSE